MTYIRPPSNQLPKDIAVDMDGTLLTTDTLDEAFLRGLFSQPLLTLRRLPQLLRGRAALKEAVAPFLAGQEALLPQRTDFIDWLTRQAESGRRLHLVTAADQRTARAVAEHVGLFDSIIASEGEQNLKGPIKRDRLLERFPEGFAYAGDSRADLDVWKAADSIVLAGASPGVQASATALGKPVEAVFPRAKAGFAIWRKALRLHQWSKNLLLFIPMVLGHALGDPAAVLSVLLGFVLMGVTASGTYILNDLSDLASDRVHATKRNRPFASGRLNIRQGFLVALLAIVLGLAAATLLAPLFGLLLLVYTAVTLSYSLGLKRIAMLDISILAGLYTLRLAMGAVLAEVPLSEWLAVFAAFFFLSLSLAKRHVEIARAAAKVTGRIPGRGYHTQDAILTLPLGVAAAMCALLVMVLFLVFEAFQSGGYQRPEFLWVAPVAIFLWLARIWMLAGRNELEDDPVSFAVRDRVSHGLGLVLGLAVGAAL